MTYKGAPSPFAALQLEQKAPFWKIDLDLGFILLWDSFILTPMARRASSKSNTGTTIGILALVVVLLGVGYFFLNRKPSGFTDPPLPIRAFLSNANSLRGNTYSVEGQVHAIRPQDSGKFIHLRVADRRAEEHIFVIVPNTLNSINIEREQTYSFRVEIKKGGIPEALELKRL